ncbi:phage tail tape measure protein [Arthrobacter sp. ISL-85]|uniref:phage tail tape measure protein n=1 Tax=Arthrobacter sp. ISL-85 TaxID=2819115 RepID=UPI001BE9D304|nr:phage tail tape measure protein [Arthrobacter sp. ISL-85]MBT2568088.1 phage tail tape measure protein [Arthrobacter sp. ISL-85]
MVSIADRSITIAIEANVRGLTAGLRTAQQATNDFGSRLEKFAKENEQHLDRVGKASMVMGGALLAGVGLAIKAASEFDSAMSEVQSSTHETAGNMDLLREAAINAGADTAFSAVEAAKGIDEMAKAGVSTKDILGGGLTGALSLAAAGSLDVGEAAEIAASSLTQFKLSGDKVPHLADLLAAGAGKAQGSVHDLRAALNQTGLVAASTGLTIEETTGGLAAFASAGLIGSDAGTSMKTMLQRLTPQSKEAAEKMAELGISAYDSQGNFKGLAAFAENLKTSMADLTPEARNAAMGIIFGSDAVRAANVLYEQGASGISDWTDKVNDSGYAAVTAQIKTDNLAGDLERLGGSFDSVLIKGGSAAAQSLRGVVQGAEDLVDAIGNIPAPILNLAVGIAGIGGGALLLGGGLMTALPKVVEFRSTLSDLAEASPRAASGLGKVAKAAGLAAAAMVGMEIFGAIAYDKHTQSTEQLANAILKLNKAASGDGISALDAALSDFGNFMGKRIAPDINSAADAIARITHPQGSDGINRWADQAFGWLPLAKSETSQVDESLRKVGDELGNLAKNGGAEAAAASFRKLSDEFIKNGSTAQDALDHMPGYRDALLDLANQAGVTLEGQDLLDFAMGKVPTSMQAASSAVQTYTSVTGEAKPVTEAMAKQLEEVGLSAQGAIVDIDAFGKSLFNAGLLSLSASDAAIGYQDAIDKMTESVKKNGTNLDINTESGRANQSAFNSLAQAAIASAEATATETLATQGSVAAQASLQGSLRTSYDDLVRAAGQLGITGDAADTMARKALGIPKNVNIDAWIADHASATLDGIKGKADAIDGRHVSMLIETIDKTVKMSEYRDDPSMVALNPATHADGGMVNYLAVGGRPRLYDMRPRGTDTVPAMLTPGEIVMRTAAVDSIGAANLLYANATGQLPPAPAPPRQIIASTGGAGDVTVFVTNPFTGAEVQAVVREVARGEVGASLNSVASTARGRAR